MESLWEMESKVAIVIKGFCKKLIANLDVGIEVQEIKAR